MYIEMKYCQNCGFALKASEPILSHQPINCPTCHFQMWRDPKVVAGAVVLCEDEILLVQRQNELQPDLWSLPAGFVNQGEEPAIAAQREVLEETQIQIEVIELLGLTSSKEIIFIAYSSSLPLKDKRAPQISEELVMAEWHSLTRLPSLAFPHDKTFIDRAASNIGLPLIKIEHEQ
jgi:8-oxo-dGTP diphosphatase